MQGQKHPSLAAGASGKEPAGQVAQASATKAKHQSLPPAGKSLPPASTPAPSAPSTPGTILDRRDGPRVRTRLRSGKIANLQSRFVVECLFHDRSERGAKLRLPYNARLPNPFYLYDDETGTVETAQIAWRKLCVLGVRFLDEKDCDGKREALAISMKKGFYAV